MATEDTTVAAKKDAADHAAAHVHTHVHGEHCNHDHDHHHHAPGVTLARQGPKVGRNDACPCGSGKKFKKCCLQHAA